MELLTDNEGRSFITYAWPLSYRAENALKGYTHEELAEEIASKGLKTYMTVTVSDRLAEEHWDDPAYMHKTNVLMVNEAREHVRRDLINKYYKPTEIDFYIDKFALPTKEFNYKEDEIRGMKFRSEDELFEYQEMVKLYKFLEHEISFCKYKLDSEGYLIEDDEGDLTEETDAAVIEAQKELLLERFLKPRSFVKHERVYDMPTPLSHWDSRSVWHQCFYVELPSEAMTVVFKGCTGSSGAREENGRWAHTFALLASKYGVETPTFFLKYDAHNKWSEMFRLETFATLGSDLNGNYQSSHAVVKSLFKGRIYRSLYDDTRSVCTDICKDDRYYC